MGGSVNEVWAENTKIYERGNGTVWSAADLSDWTANLAGTGIVIDGGLKTSGGNASYEYQRPVDVYSTSKLIITGTWNTGSSLGRNDAYNYLSFGNIEFRAYGQGQQGSIVIDGAETLITSGGGDNSDVRNDKDWTFTITIIQATGAVDYTVTMPRAGTVNGTGTVNDLDFAAIKMGYLKTGSLDDTHQTLKSITMTETRYSYTVNTSGDIGTQTIATDKDGPSAIVTVPYHRYILSGTTLYRADRQDSNPHYGLPVTLDTDNKTATIPYTAAIADVYAFREAEDFMTPVVGNNYHYIRCSNTQGGKATEYINAFTLPEGCYYLAAASYANTSTTFKFRVGGNVVFSHTGNGMWNEEWSSPIQVPANTPVQVQGGSDSYALDYVLAQAIFAFSPGNGTSTTPTLINHFLMDSNGDGDTEDADDYVVRYYSENLGVATVNETTGAITAQHNGTAVITAELMTNTEAAKPRGSRAINATATYTLTVNTEALATGTYTLSAKTETYTLSGTGYIDNSEGTTIGIEYGNSTETQYVDGGAAHCIRDNNQWHASLGGTGGKDGIPTQGTFYTIKPKENGQLTIYAYVTADGGTRNGIRLADSAGDVLERINSSEVTGSWKNYAFNTLLMKGKTYYVYAETGVMKKNGAVSGDLSYACNDAYSSLCLNNFTFAEREGTTISLIDQSLLFNPETNSNRKQLDRDIPNFKLTFGGGDGAKYTGGGIFVLRNASETNGDTSQNGQITIEPRISSGGPITITSVTLNIGNKAENKETEPSSLPVISVNGVEKSVSPNAEKSWNQADLESADKSKIVIKLIGSTSSNTKNKIQVYLNAITFTYNSDGATLNNNLGVIDLRSADYVYGYSGSDVDNDIYFFSPHSFKVDMADVTFEYSDDAINNGFRNGNTVVEPILDTNNVSSLSGSNSEVQGLIHFGENAVVSSGKVTSYDKYKVHIGNNVGTLTASYAGSDYFAPAATTTRLYSRDYVEEPNLSLEVGETYTVPAANGLSFELTTSGGTVTLTGTAQTPETALADGEVFLTTASGGAVTIENTGTATVTIKQIKVYRKQGSLTFGYSNTVGADGDVLFVNDSYMPTAFTLSGESDIASKYETRGTYSIVNDVNGASITNSNNDALNGKLTLSSTADQGYITIALTVNPLEAYQADYSPITGTVRLRIVDGMWDFRPYRHADHKTIFGRTETEEAKTANPGIEWSGTVNGYTLTRDNDNFDYILMNEANDNAPLPHAFSLQTRHLHRLVWAKSYGDGCLHLRGVGTGIYASPHDTGGEVKIPVREGMLVEINANSDDLLSEMEIENVTTLDHQDVTYFYVNSGTAESQYFLAKTDGYAIVRNPSFNLELFIRYIKVSADMAFKYGNETYFDPAGETLDNIVMNAGATTIAYALIEEDPTGIGTIDPNTGVFSTNTGQYGKFRVRASGSGTGVLAGKTGEYTAYAIQMNSSNATTSVTGSEVSFNLRDRITLGNFDKTGLTEAELKDKIVFSLVNPLPSVRIDDGSTLVVDGVQAVSVKATLGAIVKTFTCEVTGGTLADGLNPVIANDAESYTITLSGGTTHKFKVKQMYAGIMGDLKSSAFSLKFYTDGNVEVDPKTADESGVSSTTLRIEGFYDIKKGGVIPIYATYEYNSASYNLEGTLTVAYKEHIWRFQHNLIKGMDSTAEDLEEDAYNMAVDSLAGYGTTLGITGGLSEWRTSDIGDTKTTEWKSAATPTIDEPTDAGDHAASHKWKFARKIGGHTDTSIIYYYNNQVSGQNALVIPETEGLQIFSSPSDKQFGVEMNHNGGVAIVPYDCRNIMLLRGGKFTLPKLQKGQWVEVRWTRHKEDMAERILMHNLSDFDGTPITGTYKIGNCNYNLGNRSTSTYMFQATEDGDVTFEIADNIYISIQQIILHAPDWDFNSSLVEQLNGYDDTTTPAYLEAEWGATNGKAPQANHHYIWNDDAASHTVTFLSKEFQNAPNAPIDLDIDVDEPLKQEGQAMTVVTTDAGQAVFTYLGGWGKVHITLTSYSQNRKYVANRRSWTITFGQAPKQTYPYSWDFTKYFEKTNEHIGAHDTWNKSGNLRTVQTSNYNENSYASYYVEGAQLVSVGVWNNDRSTQGLLQETKGLGFRLTSDANPTTDSTPAHSLTLDMQDEVVNSGQGVQSVNSGYQTWASGKLTLTGGGTIIVPTPGAGYGGYYIYINSSVKPNSVSNAEDVSEAAGTDVTHTVTDGHGQFKYHFTANANAEIKFTSTANVYAIGVTNEFKQMTPLSGTAWATESRERSIDYTLDSLLTVNPVHANAIIERSGNPEYSDDKAKTVVKITDRRYVVPKNQGLVLKQVKKYNGSAYADIASSATEFNVPLFVPAITTEVDADWQYVNNLMRPNTSEAHPEQPFTSETETFTGMDGAKDYTRFILSDRYMTWRKQGEGAATYDEHFTSGHVAGFYRMHLFGNASYDGGTDRNTLPVNHAYLLLRTDMINAPVWDITTPTPAREYNDFVGIAGISDFAESQPAADMTNRLNDGRYYNLQGQVVEDPLRPGVYIRNGRKIAVK